jgi:four helix bundle protein
MKDNIVKSKSMKLAIEVVALCKFLKNQKRDYIMSDQLLKSGTSVGANIREAEHAESKADFKHKMSVAQKEANETLFWLELLRETDYIREEQFKKTFPLAEEIMKLLIIILKTTRNSLIKP